jgi:alginate O-acetyltransferase complex protein AlgI
MDLTSLLFLFHFFPIFLALYLIARPSLRLWLISIANIVFIVAGQPSALLPLVGISLVGYFMGRLIDSNREKKNLVSLVLWGGIAINIMLLGMFKVAATYGAHPDILQPFQQNGIVALLGLSYITFQVISYLVDVSRGTIVAEKDLVQFTVYILFFPKLVSGPITRYKQFREQISTLDPKITDIAAGLRRVLIGVVKRILIANRLAIVANSVFNLPTPNVEPHFAWLGLVAYSLQIYFDFSGYIDVALGLGRIIGVTLPENFNYPYTAQSIGDFWRRWHITLSTWFREYVFYPLERRRLPWTNQQINLVIVFLLTGLWHGPTLTFLLWGLLHGLAIAFESAGGARWLKNIWRPLRHLYVMGIVMIGWVFFRAPDLSYAFGFLTRLAGNTSGITPLPFSQTTPLPFIEPSFLLISLAALLFSFPIVSLWQDVRRHLETLNVRNFFVLQAVEDLALLAFFVLSIASHISGTFFPNIYAKF